MLEPYNVLFLWTFTENLKNLHMKESQVSATFCYFIATNDGNIRALYSTSTQPMNEQHVIFSTHLHLHLGPMIAMSKKYAFV